MVYTPSTGNFNAFVIGQGRTDARGDFSLQACHIDGFTSQGQPQGTIEYWVQVALQSSALTVGRYYFTCAYVCLSFEMQVYTGITASFTHNPGDTTTVDIGEWAGYSNLGPPADFLMAARIYSWDVGIMRAWDYMANTVGYIPDGKDGLEGNGVEVHYLAPHKPPLFAGGEPFPHYMVDGAPCAWTDWVVRSANGCAAWWTLARQIHVDDARVAMSPHMLAHLYGHYVMQDAYRRHGLNSENLYYPVSTTDKCRVGGWFYIWMTPVEGPCYGDFNEPDSGDLWEQYRLYDPNRFEHGFGYQGQFDEGTAWAEGWADFFALWIYPDPNGNFLGDSPTGPYQWHLENSCKCSPESRVAGALYDIADDGIEGYDLYAGLEPLRIWLALTYQYAGTFHAFWQSFKSYWLGVAPSDVHAAKAALFQNSVDENQPPTVLNLHVEPTSPSGWYSGEVEIVATMEDSDQEDAGFLDAEFQYMGASRNWVTIQSQTNLGFGEVRQTWNTAGLPDGNRPYRVFVSDRLELGWGAESVNLDNQVSSVILQEPFQLPWHVDNTPTFRWSYSGSGGSTDHADLYVFTAPSGICSTTEVARAMGLSGTQWTWPGPPIDPPTTSPMADGQYCWKVVATDQVGHVSESDLWLLKVDAAGPVVTLSEPASGFEGNWNRPYFEWQADDFGVSGVASQRFRVCSDAAETICVADLTFPAGQGSYQWGRGEEDALADQVWYWSVQATDLAGNSGHTLASFRNTAPQPFNLFPPGPVGWCDVGISWNPSPDRSLWYYETYFRLDGEPTPTPYSRVSTGTATTIRSLRAATLYFFSVASVDDVQARFTTTEVSATTQGKPPGYSPDRVAPTLWFQSAYSIGIEWTRYTQCDFQSYEIHRVLGQNPGFVPDSASHLTTISEQAVTRYADNAVAGCEVYTYKVKVVTVNGDQSISDPLYASTDCFKPFEGFVLFSSGQPVVGATITVTRSSDGYMVWQGRTDDGGHYESNPLATTELFDLSAMFLPACFSEVRYGLRPGWQDFTAYECQ